MKSYARVISKLFYEPALITPARHAALCHLLDARLASTEAPAVAEPDHDRDEDDVEMSGGTAIIPVHGTLVAHPEDIAMSECGCSMEELRKRFDWAEHNDAISKIVFDFRSPGGSVTGIPEMGRRILNSSKETIAFTDSECCSGAIWLAEQCERFYATASSSVGSVGVYTLCLDVSRALENDGVKVNAISAGKYKLLGAQWKPLSDDERAKLQAGVDKIYEQFKAAMETNRKISDEHFGNGLVFDGEDAAMMGFTDGVVDCLDDVLEMDF